MHIPDGFLLQVTELNLLVVLGGIVAGEVAVVVDEWRIVLKAREAAVLIALKGSLVQLLGDLPNAPAGQNLHQILQN